jgi:2-dehydro-3-deoxygluconokinase
MNVNPPRCEIAAIGECLIELSKTELGTFRQSFGGDSLNTAVYLARLLGESADIKYITAIGTDSHSDQMVRSWQAEGINVALTLRDPDRLPGLYEIQIDARGERRFLYWRGQSAARFLLQHVDFDRVRLGLCSADVIYLTGVSLAVLPAPDRAALTDLLISLANRGATIAFDTNYRASLWLSVESARAAFMPILGITRLLFATFEDEQVLWGDANSDSTLARYHAAKIPTIVIKLGEHGCLHSDGENVSRIPASKVRTVVDTTAAGDSFNAAYIAAELAGRTPMQCCRTANEYAAIVIQHRGAIIPASAAPSLRQLLDRRDECP